MINRIKTLFVGLSLASILMVGCSSIPLVGDTDSVDEVEPPEPQSISLTHTEWQIKGSNRYVVFGPQGRLSGHGGCNSFNGAYEQDGDTLKISSLATTRMMCAPEVMVAEQFLLEALQATVRVLATKNELESYDASGAAVLKLIRSGA
jgi:heat shock protein HslJ